MAACGARKIEEEKAPERKRMFNFKPMGKRRPDMESMPVFEDWDMEKTRQMRKENEAEMNSYKELDMLKECVKACDNYERTITQSELEKIGVKHDADVKVFVSKPKTLPKNGNPCIIYCHGGGQVIGTAESYTAICNLLCMRWSCVMLNLEYRLAPEHTNKGHTDLYAFLKHLTSYPGEYQVDPKRICMHGVSGGAHTVLACTNLLAQKGEADLVKLNHLQIPMLGYYIHTTPKAKLTKEEAEMKTLNALFFGYIAGGETNGAKALKAATEAKDPLIWTDQATDKTLEKYPLTVITTAEFCPYNTACQILGNRLDKAGKLAELILVPGGSHMYQKAWEKDYVKTAMDAVDKSIAVYLRGEELKN